jgi:cation:H+ antiporter
VLLSIIAVIVGILLLIRSANLFVDGASKIASYLGMSPLLIGMVVVGFGTSSPELIVSVQAALSGNSSLAIGNAYGSNIANIALILGITSLLFPIRVHSGILKKELPILSAVTIFSAWIVSDGVVSRWDSFFLLVLFALLMFWSIKQGSGQQTDELATEIEEKLAATPISLKRAAGICMVGLVVLIASARLLIWGAVNIAEALGMSNLVIGLTIVAIGTSLPELASAIAAVRQGEHDLALGNVLGSNLFNTLAVVGLAGIIAPIDVGREVFTRDMPVLGFLTLSLFVIGYRFFHNKGRINRFEGSFLVLCYIGYTYLLFFR